MPLTVCGKVSQACYWSCFPCDWRGEETQPYHLCYGCKKSKKAIQLKKGLFLCWYLKTYSWNCIMLVPPHYNKYPNFGHLIYFVAQFANNQKLISWKMWCKIFIIDIFFSSAFERYFCQKNILFCLLIKKKYKNLWKKLYLHILICDIIQLQFTIREFYCTSVVKIAKNGLKPPEIKPKPVFWYLAWRE